MSGVEKRVPKRRMLPANPYQTDSRKHGKGLDELRITKPPEPVVEHLQSEM